MYFNYSQIRVCPACVEPPQEDSEAFTGGTPVPLVSEAIEIEHSPGHIVIEIPEEILPDAGLESQD